MEESLSIMDMLQTTWQAMTWVEIWAVITGLIYVILAARTHIWCWFFGIISSGLSIYLFYTDRLYAESVLYTYYVIAGIYGWYAWQQAAHNGTENKLKQPALQIHTWNWKIHSVAIGSGIVLALILAWVLQTFTDAAIPLLDSFTTVFSFLATYMVTRKVLETWLYWVLIDLVTTGMYFYRAYYLYALLMIVYTIIAAIAYFNWRQLQKKDLDHVLIKAQDSRI